MTRRLAPALALALLLPLSACDGDDDPVVDPPGPTIDGTFTAAAPTPPPMSITLQPGTAMDDLVGVQVVVSDIDEFAGTAYQVLYDPAVARFVGASSADSFLVDGFFVAEATDEVTPQTCNEGMCSQQTQVACREDEGCPGVPLDEAAVVASATRLDQQGQDVDGSELLMTLTFRAVAETTGSPLAFGDTGTREVIRCPEDLCVGLTCALSGGACGADADCPDDECASETCAVSGGACDDDDDCDDDMCLDDTCTVSGGACDDDDDCLDNTCAGTCTLSSGACAEDEDCLDTRCTGSCTISGATCGEDGTCPGGSTDCTTLSDATLTWVGGTLAAVETAP